MPASKHAPDFLCEQIINMGHHVSTVPDIYS